MNMHYQSICLFCLCSGKIILIPLIFSDTKYTNNLIRAVLLWSSEALGVFIPHTHSSTWWNITDSIAKSIQRSNSAVKHETDSWRLNTTSSMNVQASASRPLTNISVMLSSADVERDRHTHSVSQQVIHTDLSKHTEHVILT